MSTVLRPPAELVMVVDNTNCAHVLRPADDRPVFRPTLCGSQINDLAAVYDLLDLLSAPWSLLTNPQYRAWPPWPPWPCQTCVGTVLSSATRSPIAVESGDGSAYPAAPPVPTPREEEA